MDNVQNVNNCIWNVFYILCGSNMLWYLTISENRSILNGANVDHLSEAHSTATDARARGGVIGWGIMLQAGRSQLLFSIRSLNFFQLT
jgi:hypothetical protein